MADAPRSATFPIATCEIPGHEGDISKKEAELGILPSHGISVDITDTEHARPVPIHHLSAPAYQSPLRHHRRAPSEIRVIKETLNAESRYKNNETDGKAEHHINQYIIKDEIGRGSFGAVHLAVDQYGKEYAVKEFSKSRLRKRAQSYILRRPGHERRRPGHLAAGMGFNSPLHKHSASDIHKSESKNNPLYLIKEEIAIMKKLNHPNLVSLIEVLDDPDEDSLYMVLEMCKKGVVMKVGLGEIADGYDSERCRHWFRDLILGIEYLHAQGIVHRDIKPDNLLLTEDDVLKVVDFGVSEMFEKENKEMLTAKSAGSPAFLPPELCVSKHGDISGKAADIWSMGVSLYCLRYGRIPFERPGVLELYESIKEDPLVLDKSHEPEFCDLLEKLLEKDAKKRIVMEDIRSHPWVTKNGTDPLLSQSENTAELVDMPSELEVNHAITAKLKHLMTLMQAVRKFKGLIERKRPAGFHDALDKGKRRFRSADTEESDTLQAPPLLSSKSEETYDRRIVSGILAAEGVHPDPSASLAPSMPEHRPGVSPHDSGEQNILEKKRNPPRFGTPSSSSSDDEVKEKGQAHDPLLEAPLILGIGAGLDTIEDPEDIPPQEGVAESPKAAEFSIYDTAYQEEVDRIRAAQGKSATVYLTRRVDTKKEYKADKNMIDEPKTPAVAGGAREGLKAMVDRARDRAEAVKLEASSQRDIREERDRLKQSQQQREKAEVDEGGSYFPPPPTQKKEDETELQREERREEEKKEEDARERRRDKGMRKFSAVAAKAVASTKDLGSRGGEKMGRLAQRVGVGAKEKDGLDGREKD